MDRIEFKRLCQNWHVKIKKAKDIYTISSINNYIKNQLDLWKEEFKISSNKISLLETELKKEKYKLSNIKFYINMLKSLGMFAVKKKKIMANMEE